MCSKGSVHERHFQRYPVISANSPSSVTLLRLYREIPSDHGDRSVNIENINFQKNNDFQKDK